MSKRIRDFFEQLKDGVEAVAPGLSMDKILGDIGTELKHMGAQGAHEMAAALFNGSAFVMYPHAGQESVEQTPAHGLPIEPLQKEVDGREM
ncbi:MAG: hypothetical protein ACRELG_06885 [Gemmataceae bacterium]